MVSCTFTKDELGNNIANYSHGFTGNYDTNGNPANGIVKKEKSNWVYEGKKVQCIKHTLVILCLLLSFSAKAYDFKSGGIFYNITSETSVEVSRSLSAMDLDYTGKIVIPEIVTYNENDYNVTSIGNMAFSGCEELTSITIPNSVTKIGKFAFFCCMNLTSIIIPNSVTEIGRYAFYECRSLTSVTIPNGVTSIEEYAFSNCFSLTSITIPNSVTSIKRMAFCGCIKLTSPIVIPNGVTSIGEYAFGGCMELTSITIPNSVTNIGRSAFSECRSLTSITIPDGVTSIEDRTFSGCKGLTSITIPNSITSIGEEVFQDCTGLTSVVIGKGLTDIGSDTFNGCNELKEIYCLATTPPTFNESCFQNVPKDLCKLYVPQGCYGAYLNSDWKCFINIHEEGKASVNTLYANDIKVYGLNGNITIKGASVDTPIQIYSTSGKILHNSKSNSDDTTFEISKSGIYLVKIGNNTYKVNL